MAKTIQKQMSQTLGSATATTNTTLTDSSCDMIPANGPFGNRTIGPRTVIVPADPIIWNEGSSYEYLTLVASENFGQSYISKKDVPAGTPLTDEDYWIPAAQFNAQLASITSRIGDISKQVNGYGTVSEMVADTGISAGDTVTTLGFSSSGDGGGTTYTVSDSGTANGVTVIGLSNGLFAHIIPKTEYLAEELGMVSGSDCSAAMRTVLDAFDDAPTIFFGNRTYSFNSAITFDKPVNLVGFSGHSTDYGTVFSIGANMYFQNVSGCNASNILFKCTDAKVIFNAVTLSVLTSCGFVSNYDACEIRNLCAYLKFLDCEFSTSGNGTNGVLIGEVMDSNLEYVYFTRCNFEGRSSTNGTAIAIKNGQFLYFHECDIAFWSLAVDISPDVLCEQINLTSLSVANCTQGINASTDAVSVNGLIVSGVIGITATSQNDLALNLIGNSNAYVNVFIDANLTNNGVSVDFYGHTEFVAGSINCRANFGIDKGDSCLYKLTSNLVQNSYRSAITNAQTLDIVVAEKSPISYIPTAIVTLQPSADFNYSVLNTKGGQLKIHIETSSPYNGYVNAILTL